MKWQIGSAGQFYECGDDMVVYFHPASGDTHLISNFAAYLVRQIATVDESLDAREIIELIAGDIEPEDLPELSHSIPDILNELVELDIIASA